MFDANGNMFGTTYEGGPHLTGTVFKLTRRAAQNWMEKILYSFTGRPSAAAPTAPIRWPGW